MDTPTEEQLRKAGGIFVMLAVFFFSIGMGLRLGGFSGLLIGFAAFFAALWIFVFFSIRLLKKKGLLKHD